MVSRAPAREDDNGGSAPPTRAGHQRRVRRPLESHVVELAAVSRGCRTYKGTCPPASMAESEDYVNCGGRLLPLGAPPSGGAALRSVAVLPVILTVVFGAMYVVFRSKGGYRALKIDD